MTNSLVRVNIHSYKRVREVNQVRIDRVNFAAAMARADLNVKRLAELSGLSRGTITSVKTGKSCSRETAGKLAAGLGVPVETLIKEG